MKKIVLIGLMFFSVSCMAQEGKPEISLADEIRQNFNYDSLSSLSCLNTPTGVYAIKFKVDKKKKFYDFVVSNDTLHNINNLFVDAIKKSNSSVATNKIRKGTYLQIIYFSNILSCNPYRNSDNSLMALTPDTSIKFSDNYDKEIIKVLSDQLISIEKSLIGLQQSGFQNERIICLPPALINNENPSLKKRETGFRNDIKPSRLTKEEIEKIEMMIKEIEKKKTKNW